MGRKSKKAAAASAEKFLQPDQHNSVVEMAKTAPESSDEHCDHSDHNDDHDHDDDLEPGSSLIGKDFSDVPLGELLALRQKLPRKIFDRTVFPNTGANETPEIEKNGAETALKRRKRQKKAPRVESTKRKFRDDVGGGSVFALEKSEKFDPRFAEHCGDFSEHHFKQNYAFLNELQQKEMQELRAEYKKTRQKNPEKALEIKKTIKTMENRQKTEAEREKDKERIRNLRKQNMERMKKGLKPFYVKKSELKREKLEEKFEQLKKRGKLDRHLKRKEKKNAMKQR